MHDLEKIGRFSLCFLYHASTKLNKFDIKKKILDRGSGNQSVTRRSDYPPLKMTLIANCLLQYRLLQSVGDFKALTRERSELIDSI